MNARLFLFAALTLASCQCEPPPEPCVADQPCADNAGAPCRIGKTACGPTTVCIDGAAAAVGTACGNGRICSPAGACVACLEGMACAVNPGGACRSGILSCAAGPYCADGPRRDAGEPCGIDSVCDGAGLCISCKENAVCATNPGGPCFRGAQTCVTGAPRCVDQEQEPSGTPCGGNRVCGADAGCVACTDGTACTPAMNACARGTLACGTGMPVCTASGARDAGAPCDGGVCNGLGACVACAAGAACDTGSDCTTGVIGCTGGGPLCLARPVDAGTRCDAGACDGDGGCR